MTAIHFDIYTSRWFSLHFLKKDHNVLEYVAMNGIILLLEAEWCYIKFDWPYMFKIIWKWKCQSLSHVQLFATHDCSLPGSSVHGILQARTLEWVAILFSRASSWSRDWIRVSYIASGFFTVWATRKVPIFKNII